eukprot:1056938_1
MVLILFSTEQQQLYSELLQIINTNDKAILNQKEYNHYGILPSQITDNIFIGDHRAASNAYTYDIKCLGITHVINCAAHEYIKAYPPHIQVLNVHASDEAQYRIIDAHIHNIIGFADQAL